MKYIKAELFILFVQLSTTVTLQVTERTYISYSTDAGIAWQQARQECISKGFDLATVTTAEENAILHSTLDAGSRSNCWIGLKDEGKFKWSDGNASEYRNWLSGQLNGNTEKCVEMDGNGFWLDVACDKLNLCYLCSTTMTERTYISYSTDAGINWQQARQDCILKGFDLATVTTVVENIALHSTLDAESRSNCWIGLKDERKFQWSDSNTSEYRNWLSGQPNDNSERCVEIDENGFWLDVACDKLNLCYICSTTKEIDISKFCHDNSFGDYLATGASIAAGITLGAVAAPMVLPALGFTSVGVAAGSIAAAIQTPVTAAGSAFAFAQSVGATGTIAGMGLGTVGGAVGGAAGYGVKKVAC